MEPTAEDPGPPPTLCEYAAHVTAERLDRMLSHIDGVRRGEEAAPVHQMRVWSRRSRAALEVFESCFKGRAFAEIERAVKTATDALGEARDLDVMAQKLEERAAKIPAAQRTGVESFVTRLRKRRDSLQGTVAAAVTDLEGHNLADRFRDLTERAATDCEQAVKKPQRRGGRRRKGGRTDG